MATLILALPLTRPTVATEFEFVLSSPARPLSDHGTAPLALLPAADALVLVAPIRALSWHRVSLPPVAPGRMRAALAGVLEEHLLDDPAQLALALVPGRADDGTSLVAACDKAWLQAALELFEQARRPATRVVAAFAPTGPDGQGTQLHVLGTPDDASLVICDALGVTCLPLPSAAAVFADKALPQGEVFAEPAVAGMAEQLLGRAVVVQPAAQRLLQASRCDWDLAQFDLSMGGGSRLARRWQQHWRALAFDAAWRPARWGLAGLVLAQLVGINAWAWKLDAAARDKQQRVNTLLTQTFPGVRTIVDAPLQMQRQVALLRQSSGGVTADDFEPMLAALGAALPPGSTPQAIDFAPGELTVRGLTLQGPQREQLQSALHKRGYQVRMETGRWIVRVRSGS